MEKRIRLTFLAVTVLSSATVFAQDEPRSSSSMNLPLCQQADVTIPFAISDEGKRFNPTWGLDQAWISESNLLKGINHMGKENIGIGRSAFRFTDALTNDSVLSADVINAMKQRNAIFDKLDKKLPIVFTADQEAGTNEYFVKNKVANTDHWAAMINSHVHWMQANTQHPVVGISPFNEGDYWTTEEGSSAARQVTVAKLLKEQYPRCATIPMVGGNTLNNDKALEWYTNGKQYYDWGNTHQLAGSFDNFAKFYQQLSADGKVGYGDEMHNVGEAMIGLEYGMSVGIWWGFDSRARGEFCQISRNGVRLAYGEHRNNWTAASVYRHDDGRVKAFIGSSERQAYTTSYMFVSTEREVYYDGHGPFHEFLMTIPGGTGYQKGQSNAERVIDVTWGADVAPSPINGTYKLVNMISGGVVACPNNGNSISLAKYNGAANQHWTVTPSQSTVNVGGDFSFYNIESVPNANVRMNVRNYSKTTNSDIIAWTQDYPTSNEQWYLEYAGNGYYFVRNRESALYLTSAGTTATARVVQDALKTGNSVKRQMWRFVPVDIDYETVAPAVPQGLSATAAPASVRLEWTAGEDTDLDGYMVLRADQATRTWNTIARKVKTPYYVDNTCRQGQSYYYRVRAIDRAENISEWSDSVAATPSGHASLIAHWQMNGNIYDATKNMMDAVLSTETGRYVEGNTAGKKALSLVGNNKECVQLPYEVANSDELTIALWVNWRGASNWQRIFDFGTDTEHYMFLTPCNSYTSKMRFAIKNGGDELSIDCPNKLTSYQWKHVVVTMGTEKTSIYVDGEEVASSTGITIRPNELHPLLNYLGRSQFASDPYLTAYLADVRIYNYAISADDVKTVMGGQELSGVNDLTASEKKPAVIHGLDGIRRSALRPGLNIINGKKVVK
jgi:hypothetical protein